MFILRLIINALAVYFTAMLLNGVTISDFSTAILVSLVLGIVNTLIKPILLVFTLPINILTLGLFTWVINALMVVLVQNLVSGFQVVSFGWAILFSLVLSVVSSLLYSLVEK